MLEVSDQKPIKRLVHSMDGSKLVIEVRARTVAIKPYRSKDPSASVEVPWDSIYQRALMARVTRR